MIPDDGVEMISRASRTSAAMKQVWRATTYYKYHAGWRHYLSRLVARWHHSNNSFTESKIILAETTLKHKEKRGMVKNWA